MQIRLSDDVCSSKRWGASYDFNIQARLAAILEPQGRQHNFFNQNFIGPLFLKMLLILWICLITIKDLDISKKNEMPLNNILKI